MYISAIYLTARVLRLPLRLSYSLGSFVPDPKATAAGKGSAASLEFLEDAYKRARGGTGDAKSIMAEGDDSRNTDGKGDGAANRAANGKLAQSGTVLDGREQGEEGEKADDGVDVKPIADQAQDASALTEGGVDGIEEEEPPDGGEKGEGGGVDGLGVVGEEETVALALQALSKVIGGVWMVFDVAQRVFVSFFVTFWVHILTPRVQPTVCVVQLLLNR